MSYPIAAGTLAIIGSVFILIASIGVVRMPDLLLRLQVTSKASVIGFTCILLAVALHFASTEVTLRVALIICFIVLTIPVATHMLARAGYTSNVQLSAETIINELAGQYDPQAHVLAGEEPTTWELDIPRVALAIGKRVVELGLPDNVLILAIQRHGEVVVPRGQTVIEAQDKLKVLASPDQLNALQEILGADVRAMLADTFEFPLRPSMTIGQLQEFYSIYIDAPPDRTLAEVMSHELRKWNPTIGETVKLGPLILRVLRLTSDGRIEMVGMSIVSEDEATGPKSKN